MALAIGTRLGGFEIIGWLGVGGMGEVYRATDTKLKRQVALKVLPDALTGNPERLARFQREAEVLAALNHPHIAQIYGLEESDGVKALVMELVDGPTLAERIAQGALPVDEALAIARQMAEALEAAHEQGIIHRDLKPANIKVREDGTVKVLDFGLAKAMDPAGASPPGVSQLPTITSPALMTDAGMILGTAAYMSPEQARGKPVDKRADIWAFGCVLFEMLTGTRAFGGEEVSEVLSRVLQREPDWARLPPALSPALGVFIRQCVTKDPKQRIPDIATMRLALDGTFETGLAHSMTLVQTVQSGFRPSLPLGVGALVTGAVLAALVAWSMWPSTAPGPVARFAHVLPQGQSFVRTNQPILAISSDGRAFAYLTSGGLYVRTIGQLEARRLPVTDARITSVFFSPNGDDVGYWSGDTGQLKRIATGGGTPVVIASNVSNPFGVSWGSDNTILIGQPRGIVRLSARGGNPELIVPAQEGERIYGPRLLPNKDAVIFSVTTTGWDESRVVVQSLSSGERRVLVEGGSDARYVSTGHLVYAQGFSVFAVAFDPNNVTVSGGAVSLIQGVMRGFTSSQSGVAHFAISDSGTLVYFRRREDANPRTLVWVDRDGREEPIDIPPRLYAIARLAPDGSRVALQADGDIWTYSFRRNTLERATSNPGVDRDVVWTPDGTSLTYYAEGKDGGPGIFRRPSDGTGTDERLSTGVLHLPQAWSPDGLRLVFTNLNEDSVPSDASTTSTGAAGQSVRGRDLGVVTLGRALSISPLMVSAVPENLASISPDGRWIAFDIEEAGAGEVVVRPFPDVASGRWSISTAGGADPVWSRDGRALYYRQDRAMMEVLTATGAPSNWGRPTAIFEIPDSFLLTNGPRHFDVAMDGRFLMLKDAESGSFRVLSQIVVVENWFDELKRLAPTR